MDDTTRAGHELLDRVAGLEIEVEDFQRGGEPDAGWTRAVLRIDADHVATCGLGLAFALGVLSFDDGRPRGMSEIDYAERDELTVADLVRHLSFEHGALRLSLDYLRGRMLKTDVSVHPDGRVVLVARNRDLLPEQWIEKLQGKERRLRVLPDAPDGDEA